jgi:hypothetical protein
MLLSGLDTARTFVSRHVTYVAWGQFRVCLYKQNYHYWDENNATNLHEWPEGEREFSCWLEKNGGHLADMIF